MKGLRSIFKKEKNIKPSPPSQIADSYQSTPIPDNGVSLSSVFPGIPFQADLTVSPDESLVCCVTPNSCISAYESGSNIKLWQIAVPTSRNSSCVFTSPGRLLVVNKTYNSDYSVKDTIYMLVDTASGQLVDCRSGPSILSRFITVDLNSGIFFGEIASEKLLVGNTSKDKMEFSTREVSYLDSSRLFLSPKKELHFFSFGKLFRLEDNEQVEVMLGRNWAHFEPPEMIYCGDGFYDRSGASALYIFNLKTKENHSVSWDNEPISRILSSGPGRLLISSDGGSMSKPFYSLITLFSIQDNTKVWTLKLDNMPMYHESMLEVILDQGFALIQTSMGMKLIDLEDGKTRINIPMKSQQWVWTKWLSSRKLLYIAGNLVKEQPGIMACYKI